MGYSVLGLVVVLVYFTESGKHLHFSHIDKKKKK